MTTHFQLHLDRFIGEVASDPPRQAKAHLLSVIGSETQISAIVAAIHMEEAFTVEAPGVAPIRAQLRRNAQCYRGSIQLTDRKRAVRHAIAVSEEFWVSSASTGRTLLAHSEPRFVWSSLAHIHGLPGVPEWADWFIANCPPKLPRSASRDRLPAGARKKGTKTNSSVGSVREFALASPSSPVLRSDSVAQY